MIEGKLFLKKDVVPHIFECQNRMMPLKPRSAVMKRKRREILESIENTPDPSLECSLITETHDSQNIEISNDKSVQVSFYPHKRSKQVQVEMKIPQRTVALSPEQVNVRDDGFGGRTSDLKIFEESRFMDILPPGACIMADRGFKYIEEVLAKKNSFS
ncbi:hypothetical protein PYW08_006007 [Mythimna loreyi]|uniref:Uncharacterized protein n=1 Tax=Mythimna loreyi TaxID=667449 RepID=A0ACC2QMF1_9NEOP|nr:hypothetical protein PYW08_006007 [Mythimna loreyi]